MGQGTEEQLTGEIAGTRADLSRDLDALGKKVSPSQVMERRKAATRSRLQSMRNRVMGTAQENRDSMSSARENIAGTAHGAVDTIEQKTEGNPLAAGLIAFGAGWLISSLLPASEKEAQGAQALVERAKEQGRPLAEEAKSVGQEMGENLKGSAQSAAQEVKGTAQEGAQEVKGTAEGSAQTVKQEGQSSAQTVQEDVQSRKP